MLDREIKIQKKHALNGTNIHVISLNDRFHCMQKKIRSQTFSILFEITSPDATVIHKCPYAIFHIGVWISFDFFAGDLFVSNSHTWGEKPQPSEIISTMLDSDTHTHTIIHLNEWGTNVHDSFNIYSKYYLFLKEKRKRKYKNSWTLSSIFDRVDELKNKLNFVASEKKKKKKNATKMLHFIFALWLFLNESKLFRRWAYKAFVHEFDYLYLWSRCFVFFSPLAVYFCTFQWHAASWFPYCYCRHRRLRLRCRRRRRKVSKFWKCMRVCVRKLTVCLILPHSSLSLFFILQITHRNRTILCTYDTDTHWACRTR